MADDLPVQGAAGDIGEFGKGEVGDPFSLESLYFLGAAGDKDLDGSGGRRAGREQPQYGSQKKTGI